MKTTSPSLSWLAVGLLAGVLLLLWLAPAQSGGPRAVDGLGQPLVWSTAAPIAYHPDAGPLGTLTNSEARAILASAFAEWASVGVVSFTEGAALPGDVSGNGIPATNPDHFLHHWRIEGDGRSPVIFDQDGSVIDGLFGAGARFDILGLSGLDTPLGHCSGGSNHGAACVADAECADGGGICAPSSTIVGASLVINGLFYDGVGLPGSPPDLSSPQALEAVMVHEIGHLLNLDHSVVNHELAGDGNPANDIYLPTMYPLMVEDEAALATLYPDDIAALRGLYDPGPATTGISGVVRTPAGIPFQGANVVLRKSKAPLATAYSAVSGGRFFPCNPGSACDPCETPCDPGNPLAQGAYGVAFIVSGGGPYTVCVEQIDTRFSLDNGAVIGPLATPPLLPGPEECYDLSESGTVADDPDAITTLTAGLLTGIDVQLNALPGSGDDPFEPNDTLGSAATLADLAGGHDTAPGHLGSGDLDFYAVPVVAGQRLRVDLESEEPGSALDAVIGLYDASNALLMVVDDAIDPESGAFSVDPALDVTVGFTGTAKVVVSSYPDLDLNGAGGTTTGGYWIRVRFEDDSDMDGVPDGTDNCPGAANGTQLDFEGDGLGDSCDADDDGDGLADVVETNTGTFVDANNTGTNPLDPDSDGDGVTDGVEVAGGTNPNLSSATPGLFSGQGVVSSSASLATSVFAADMDDDGDVDLLSASYNDNKIAWYENDGASPPGWTARTISTSADGAESVFAADVDGDGDVDALSASFLDNTIAWYENDGASPPGWTERMISTTASDAMAVAAADVDGDGDTDVLSALYDVSTIAWYENDGASPPGWTPRTITATAFGARSVFAADVDGDGDLDAVSASQLDDTVAWYESDGASPPGWTPRTISTAAASVSWVSSADVDGDGDADVLSASADDDTIAWYENDGASPPGWTARTITSGADAARSVFAADLDGDGDADVLSASANDDKIAWSENDGASPPVWTTRTITTAADLVQAVFAADVDGDGDADVLSASFNDSKIAWYENRSIHPSAAFPVQSVISTSADNARSVGAADVDGDGDTDLLSASAGDEKVAWYQNSGATPPSWTPRIISTTPLDGVLVSVAAADLDRDGDIDVLSGWIDGAQVVWYENDGAPLPGWTEHVLALPADGTFLHVADLDGDSDLDIVTPLNDGAQDPIHWLENDGGVQPAWTPRSIPTGGIGYAGVSAADVDGDGVTDLLATAPGANRVAWFENDGASPPGWTQRVVTSGAMSAMSVSAADVDGDGDTDLLSASVDDDRIAWYENNGASPPVWTPHVISTAADGAFSVFAADADGDGDTDVLSASMNDDEIAWYENDGASPPVWTPHVISTAADGAFSVFAADVDGDGDLDALSASLNDDKIAWYENRGGPYAFATESVAPSTLANGATAALLRIDLVHRGRAGDSPVTPALLAFELEESPGDPLSGAEAGVLFEALAIYLDDGSGVFEDAGSDELVSFMDSYGGGITFDLFLTDPRLHVSPGQAKSFFVVAEMTANASTQTPHQFRATHITEDTSPTQPSTVIDAALGLPIAGEFSPEVSTPIVVATGPDLTAPAVTAVFPSNGSVDVALSTSFVLAMSEPVDSSTATPLSVGLSAGGLKVPGEVLVSNDGTLVTFDPAGLLAIDTDYVLAVTNGLRDLAGNGAVPFSAAFDTTNAAGGSQIEPHDIGDLSDEDASGAVLDGADADDHFGFSVAAVGDVNLDNIADLVVGSPNANVGANVDAGKARLVFGGPELQSNAADAPELIWVGSAAQEFAGETVARAGDIDDDGIADFAVGAPRADLGGADAGVVYVVFGDAGLDELSPGPIELGQIGTTGRGVVLVGDSPGDLAGTAVTYAGDLDGDGDDDLLVGAPGASPGGRTGAGKAYVIHGPLAAGTIDLGTVGTTTAGLVFHGENAGDAAGSALSWWEDATGPDDLLIGAPGATVLDEFGAQLDGAGYLYAIHGGSANLDAKATAGGVIELSRVANGLADQVDGVVFLGAAEDARIGRSVTGAVDVDDDGVEDVIVGAHNEVWLIPGDGPKTISGSSPLDQQVRPTVPSLARQLGGGSAAEDFGATVFTPGTDGVLGDLTVGPAGDVNADGIDDFIVGAAGADPGGRVDAGKAYIVYGRPVPFGDEVLLSEVGVSVPGLVVSGAEGVDGAEPGDGLGAAVGGGFDLTGDGVDDALVGAPFADALESIPTDAGQAYVISPVSPDEVVALLLGKSGGSAVLEWTVPHRALVYNVYRGLLSVLRSVGQVRTSDMAQLACEIATDADADDLPDTTDGGLPPLGDAFLYLVTAENLAGEGPLGPPGAVPPRVLDAHCP